MAQGPSWKADSHPVAQWIANFLWNMDQEVHYCTYNSLALDPILRELYPVHTLTPSHPIKDTILILYGL